MDYLKFKNEYSQLPLIVSRDIYTRRKAKQQNILNQLNRWQDRDLLVQLKRGIYLLNKSDRKVNPSGLFIANHLYEPSYVSLEYALSFYGLTLEKTTNITSVTTRKTARFLNPQGQFIYQHIKPEAFRDFKTLQDEENLNVFIATPEKALVDLLYLNLSRFNAHEPEKFIQFYRLNNLEHLKRRHLMQLAQFYGNSKLTKMIQMLCPLIKRKL